MAMMMRIIYVCTRYKVNNVTFNLNGRSVAHNWATRVQISDHKQEIVVNLYTSGIPEEFIALQLDLDIPTVISILKEKNVYQKV